MVMASARGRARADAQSRSDGRGSVTDRQDKNPRGPLGGFCFLRIRAVNAPERRLWAIRREDRRAAVARRSELTLFQSKVSRVRVRLIDAAA